MKPIAFLCLASASIATLLFAGPLLPPAGPIASTYKTLTEVEPRTVINSANTPGDANAVAVITSPGSYVLAGDLSASGGKDGVRIDSDNVRIDLRGFSIIGASGPSNFASGITTSTSRRNIVVRNGTVRNWGGYGIIGPVTLAHFEDLAVLDNKLGQLEVFNASDSIARNLRIRATSGEMNLQLGANSIIENCTVEGGSSGIMITSGTVSHCTVNAVSSVGIRSGGGIISDCTVTGITSAGSFNNGAIVADGHVRIERCTISNSVAAGIFLGGNATVVQCSLWSCAKGVLASQFQSGRSQISQSTFRNCTTAILLETPGHLVAANQFSQNTTNFNAVPGSTFGEFVDCTGGATLTAANAHAFANIIH